VQISVSADRIDPFIAQTPADTLLFEISTTSRVLSSKIEIAAQQWPVRVERRLSAILAADVAGYSRLMHNDEEATHSKVTALLTDAVARQ
jgi:class 3 adenylate cyclase